MTKNVKSKKKIWRINLVAVYSEGINPDLYRETIDSIVYNLARLYRLEIAISYDHQFPDEFGSDTQHTPVKCVEDLYYLRSTDQSFVDRKKFENLIGDIFYGSFFYNPFEVYCMYQKYNRKIKFPNEFERPLFGPFVLFSGVQGK